MTDVSTDNFLTIPDPFDAGGELPKPDSGRIPEPDLDEGTRRMRKILYATEGLTMMFAGVAYGYQLYKWRPVALGVTAALGIFALWAVVWAVKRVSSYKAQRDAAMRRYNISSCKYALETAERDADYFRGRCRDVEAEVADLRAQLAAAQAQLGESQYFTDKYRPAYKGVPAASVPDTDTHKFTSASGRTADGQRRRAYDLHVIGWADERIADDLGVSVSTARQYIRAGKKIVGSVTVDNPNFDPEEGDDVWNPQKIKAWPSEPLFKKEVERRLAAGEELP